MFQNVAGETMQNENENYKKNMRILLILKELFRPQNVIAYILTFLVSMINIKGAYIPLGLAMVAAALGSTIPVALIYVSSLIGTGIAFGSEQLISFFWISLIYYILVAIFKPKVCVEERNEVYKTGARLFWAYVLVSLFNQWTSNIWLVDLVYSCLYAGILYVFYKVFVNALAVIKNLGIKSVFTSEEMIAVTVLISIAVSIFSKVTIFDMSVANITVILAIMILGWKSGMLVGATSGIAAGFVISFVQGSDLAIILNFAVSGIFAGVLSKFGKIGVIIGFICGNMFLYYLSPNNINIILSLREIFISSIFLLLIPRNIKFELEDLIANTKLLDNKGETRLEDNKKIINQLDDLCQSFEETFIIEKESNVKDKLDNYQKFSEIFFDNLEEIKENIFYEDFIDKNSKIVHDIFKESEKEDIVLEENLIQIFRKNNNYIVSEDETIKSNLSDIIKIINRSLKMMQIEDVKEQESKKTKKIIKNIHEEISKTIENTTNSILLKNDKKFEKKEKELLTIFSGKNIPVKDMTIKKLKNGKFIVDLQMSTLDNFLREKEKITNISDIISKFLGNRVSFQKDRKNIDKNEYVQTYSSEDKFIMQVGSSKISKDNSMLSGDSNLQMRLNDGKYILAISDGMGTGELARENSRIVIKKLKTLLENGFEKEETVSLINNTLSIKTEKDEYATLDMCVLDLFEGNISIVKNGACNTYIKNKKNILIVKSSEMPIGVGMEVSLKEKNIPVSEGDIILMCSDGLLESKDEMKKDWIEEFLRNANTNNVQKISDMILAEAIDNNYGIASDDITVIVAKIIKKK